MHGGLCQLVRYLELTIKGWLTVGCIPGKLVSRGSHLLLVLLLRSSIWSESGGGSVQSLLHRCRCRHRGRRRMLLLGLPSCLELLILRLRLVRHLVHVLGLSLLVLRLEATIVLRSHHLLGCWLECILLWLWPERLLLGSLRSRHCILGSRCCRASKATRLKLSGLSIQSRVKSCSRCVHGLKRGCKLCRSSLRCLHLRIRSKRWSVNGRRWHLLLRSSCRSESSHFRGVK